MRSLNLNFSLHAWWEERYVKHWGIFVLLREVMSALTPSGVFEEDKFLYAPSFFRHQCIFPFPSPIFKCTSCWGKIKHVWWKKVSQRSLLPYELTWGLELKLFNLTWLNVGAFRSWNMILFLRSSSTSYDANECPYGRQFASSDQEESNQTVKKKLTKDVPDLVITKVKLVNIDSNYGISFPVLI